MTVSSGDQVLGVVEGNMLCGSTLSARGIMGEMLFYSIGGTETSPSSPGGCCGSTPSKFTLISNGVALARIEKSPNGYGGYSITLFNSRNMDSRTKALLIFTGYLMVSLQNAYEFSDNKRTHFFTSSIMHFWRIRPSEVLVRVGWSSDCLCFFVFFSLLF